MAAEREQVRDLVHAVEHGNEVLLEVQLVDRIRRRNVGDEYHVTDIPTAYPVYELNFEEHLIPVLDGVHEVANLLTLGRHGLFLNNSMDDNVLLGMQIADHINRPEGADSRAWKTEMLSFMNLRFQGK